MYACPKCGSKNLEVDVVTIRALVQDEDGNIQTDAARCGNYEEWNDDSFMMCVDCDCHSDARTFKENDE